MKVFVPLDPFGCVRARVYAGTGVGASRRGSGLGEACVGVRFQVFNFGFIKYSKMLAWPWAMALAHFGVGLVLGVWSVGVLFQVFSVFRLAFSF